MTLATVIAHTEETAPLIAPPIVIAAVAAVVFLALLVVVWSYRHVAHRHNDKTDLHADAATHGTGH